MKSLPFVALLLLLRIGSGYAQPPEGDVLVDTGTIAASYASDILFDRIEVDMNRTAVTNQAERMGWKVSRRTRNAIVFRLISPDRMNARMTIGFTANKARTAAVEYTARKGDDGTELIDAIGSIRADMLKRADDVDAKGTRTTFLHATSDGRLVRTVWNQVNPRKVTIEATAR